MLIKSNNRGFAMLEVILAVVIVAMVSMGVYALYARSQRTVTLNAVKQQIIALSTVFSNLADMHLTEGLNTESGLVELLYNANQLPQQYFRLSNGEATGVVNPHGVITFSNVSARSFTATVGVGFSDAGLQTDFCTQISAYAVCTNTPGTNSSININVDAH